MSDAHKLLMEEWYHRPPHEGQCFIADGVIDPAKWETSQAKVLLLLKESYDEPSTPCWDLREAIRTRGGPWGNFWTAADWCYAAHSIAGGHLEPRPRDDTTRHQATEAFMSSAIVNVKKSGGRPVSDDEDLALYVEGDREFIRRQVELIGPDIVICGKVWPLVRRFCWPDAKEVYDRVWRWEGLTFVDFWHHANRFHKDIGYYALACLLNQTRALWVTS